LRLAKHLIYKLFQNEKPDKSMQKSVASPASGSNYLYQIVIIGLLFFIFGFVTWLNGTLIPFLQQACELSNQQALFVTFAFYISYFFLAIPSSFILKRTGFKNGMALGLVVMALGCLVFIPAANARAFELFLTGLFVQGMGLALLQTASNPYISIIGPIESAAQRISIMGICNKVAGILSPIILSSIVLKNASAVQEQIKAAADAAARTELLDSLAQRVISPYVVMAVVLVGLAFMIRASRLPEIDTAGTDASSEDAQDNSRRSIFSYPNLWLGVLALFLYVGAEVMSGDVIGLYGRYLGFSPDSTKFFTAFTLSTMLLGYVLSIIFIPRFISQQRYLLYSAALGIVLTVVAYLTTGKVALASIALMGLANAVMWPAIFPLAIRGLGRHTQMGSALLVMGIAGGAVVPQVYALLEKNGNPPLALLLTLLPCYLYILYYGAAGHKSK
jgi:MFS transporter, FHS family, L-fucose permease